MPRETFAMLANSTYYHLKAEEFEARAEAEEQYENIREAYRKLAADYRKLAEQSIADSPSLVPKQERLL